MAFTATKVALTPGSFVAVATNVTTVSVSVLHPWQLRLLYAQVATGAAAPTDKTKAVVWCQPGEQKAQFQVDTIDAIDVYVLADSTTDTLATANVLVEG